jgi:hypothetical protein
MVRLKNELSYVYSSPEFCNKPVYELHQDLHAMGLTEALPEVAKLSTLIFTIPAASAFAEKLFLRLLRIHTYQRNTQGQDRLSGLSLLSIKKILLIKLKKKPTFNDSVLEVFFRKGSPHRADIQVASVALQPLHNFIQFTVSL